MDFEFDPDKSLQNKNKHGIDFETAQSLWTGPSAEFSAKSEYENRFAIIGMLRGKLHTCIYTLRNDKIRIISCRRSRKNEVKLYEKARRQTKNV